MLSGNGMEVFPDEGSVLEEYGLEHLAFTAPSTSTSQRVITIGLEKRKWRKAMSLAATFYLVSSCILYCIYFCRALLFVNTCMDMPPFVYLSLLSFEIKCLVSP